MMKKTFPLIILLAAVSCMEKPGSSQETNSTDTLVLKAELEYSINAELGEGAFWDYEAGLLWWVDIEGKTVNLYDPAQKSNEVLPLEERIGTVVPGEKRGTAAVALETGIYVLDLESMLLENVCSPEAEPDSMRFNDGKCDPSGRLWVGSMSLSFITNAGSLYRVSEDGQCKKMLDSTTVSNGIVWSRDKRTMYYIDSYKQNVRAFDYNDSTGEISNERKVVSIPSYLGFPDGMAIDAEDKLWIAHWGGGLVGRWDPESGRLMAKVEVPALNVTSCAFGGPNLDVLYITTAGQGMEKTVAARFPEAGSLFIVKPGVKGVQSAYWGKP